jgi:biotin transport system ATP-binding protein
LKNVFSIHNLVKTFPGANNTEIRVLDEVSLDIYEGQCLLIAGSNGSGKTMLMRIITGLLEPSSGEVLFRGEPLEKAGIDLRRSVGLVFQDAEAQILGETVAEDIAFGPRNLKMSKAEVETRVEEALREVGLEDKQDYPPRRLSGGEKRRLAVAGILAMGGNTIIMDEPFANLDWPGVVQVIDIIKKLKEKKQTVVILTHELEKALPLGDRLVILHKGRIRDQGKPAEVLDRLKPEYGVRDPREPWL